MEGFSPSQAGAAGQSSQNSVRHIPPMGKNGMVIPPMNPSIVGAVAMPPGCPVSLHAQHGADGSMIQVDKGRPKGLAQLLRLTITDPSSRQIVSARLRVHGLSGVPRATNVSSVSNEGDSVQSFTVAFEPGPQNTAVARLWVPAVSAVLKIDLVSVTYADGSSRIFFSRENCRVTPDPLMLISTR